jgi:hypothetical protein
MIIRFFDKFFVCFVGNTAVCNYRGIELSAILYGTGLGFVINVYYAEAGGLSLAPLKVVGKGPMVITLDAVFGLADEL